MGYKRNVRENVRRMLYANSGNICAMYGCNNRLVCGNTANISEICHIEAVNEEGSRYNKNLTDELVNSYDNLVLLCPTCHSKVDNKLNELYYTVDFLKDMKQEHERSVREALLEKPAIEPPVYIETKYFHLIAKKYYYLYHKEIDVNDVYKAFEKVMTLKVGLRSLLYGIVVECSDLENIDMHYLCSVSNLSEYEIASMLIVFSEQRIFEETQYTNPLDGYEDMYGDYHLVQNDYLYKMANGSWVFRKKGKVFKVIYELIRDKQAMYNFMVYKNFDILNAIEN